MNNERRARLSKLDTDVRKIAAEMAQLDADYGEWQESIKAAYVDFAEHYNSLKSRFDDENRVLEEIKDDEQEAFDNLSEGLQQAERGTAMEDAVQYMESAAGILEALPDELDELTFPELPELDLEDFATQLDDAANV